MVSALHSQPSDIELEYITSSISVNSTGFQSEKWDHAIGSTSAALKDLIKFREEWRIAQSGTKKRDKFSSRADAILGKIRWLYISELKFPPTFFPYQKITFLGSHTGFPKYPTTPLNKFKKEARFVKLITNLHFHGKKFKILIIDLIFLVTHKRECWLPEIHYWSVQKTCSYCSMI